MMMMIQYFIWLEAFKYEMTCIHNVKLLRGVGVVACVMRVASTWVHKIL